jgi:hypothetical protein
MKTHDDRFSYPRIGDPLPKPGRSLPKVPHVIGFSFWVGAPFQNRGWGPVSGVGPHNRR